MLDPSLFEIDIFPQSFRMHNLDKLPPYAGIAGATRVGLSVEECAARIARLAAISRSRIEIFAAHLVHSPEWEMKSLFGLWLWEDACNYRMMEQRLRELRTHPSAVQKVLSLALGDMLTELLHAPGTLELLSGLATLGEAELKAMNCYCAKTQPLVDQPSIRLLRTVEADLVERQKLVAESLKTLCATADDRKRSEDWKAHSQAFLTYAGGIFGDEEKSTAPPAPRAKDEFRLRRHFVRDERFRTTLPKTGPEQYANDRMKSMMWTRLQEMTAAELVASVIVEWDGLPTDALVDLARHCWDEVRHSLFGQAALEAEGVKATSLPSWIGYGEHTMPEPPQKRYSHLAIATEAGLMAYPGGKRGEWEFCCGARHPLMMTFQDFDWADEVTHVNYGRRWLIDYFCKGDREAARKLADETVAERKAYYLQFEVGANGPIDAGY